MFAIAIWDAPRAAACCSPATASGSSRSTTGSPAGRLSFASELKALLRQPGFSREIDPDALEAFLAFNSIPAPLTIFARGAQAARRPLLRGRAGRGDDRALRAARRPPRPSECATEGDEALADELRERLRDSVRAHLVADVPVGVLLSGGIDSAALTALAAEESGYRVQHLLDRLRGELLQRARPRAPGRRALRHRPPRAGRAPRRRRAAAEAGRGLRRAVRRLLGAAHLPGLAAGRGHVKVALSGEGGDELFGGYYTYVADPLAPRVGGAAPLAAPAGRAAAELLAKVSFDYRAKRFARGAHLPPLERHHAWKEIFSPEARAALLEPGRRGLGPARPLPRPLRRDRGRRRAGPAPGRRPRHLPGRRPAGEDRPRQHGPLARGARPVPRPGRRRAGARAADASRRSAASRRSGCCAGRSRRCCRGRSCAAASRASRSRPRPGCAATWSRSRARCSRPRRRAPGLLRPGGGHRDARRARRAARGPQPPALGPAGLHALARPLRASSQRRAGRANSEARGSMPDIDRRPLRLRPRRVLRLDAGAGREVARLADRGAIDEPERAACTSSRRRGSAASAILAGVLSAGCLPALGPADPRDPGRRGGDRRGRRRRRPVRPAGRA